jgi:hypothetical protein
MSVTAGSFLARQSLAGRSATERLDKRPPFSYGAGLN